MAHIFLIVEGSTEEQFYKNDLQQHYLNPESLQKHYFGVVQMPSKKNIYSREKKGGRISYETCVNNVRRFIRSNTHCELILLVLDYYGLDPSFYNHLTTDHLTVDQRVEAIQSRLEQEIDLPKFLFRLQVHEFEAYLFSSPSIIAHHFAMPESLPKLEEILTDFENDPEKINNHPKLAPSKRLMTLFPGFGKTSDGLTLARKIGIPTIRQRCERFNQLCLLIDQA